VTTLCSTYVETHVDQDDSRIVESVKARLRPIFAEALREPRGWGEATASRVRALGAAASTARHQLEPLVSATQTLTADFAGNHPVAVLTQLSTKVITELAAGYHDSMVGASIPESVRSCAAVAVRGVGARIRQAKVAFARYGGVTVVASPRGDQGRVLLPAEGLAHAKQLCDKVAADLDGPVWFALSWQGCTVDAEDWTTAEEVLGLVLASGLKPGVYGPSAVLVEYAAVKAPSVAGALRTLIRPVMDQEILLQTLEALLATDGNRSRAAENLVIHRSTIDYRLARIQELTGQSPCSAAGLGVLGTALTVYRYSGRYAD
jgi:PucR C-terminal helix-turn-helix domain